MLFRTLVLILSPLLAVQAGEPQNFAPDKSLPEGKGIAAKYSGDAGIEADVGWIFSDDFEQGEMGKKWDDMNNPNGNVLRLAAPGAEPGLLGKNCLQVEAHLDKDTGGSLTKWFESAPTVYVRFYVKFDEKCDYIHHFVTLRANKGLRGGDKWTGFGKAGLKPVGDDRFSTSIEPMGDWGRRPPPGKWNFYSYWCEMGVSPDGKFWGNSFTGNGDVIQRGKWICVEFMLKHNTPGEADGEHAYWIDGKLEGHWKGIKWRTVESLLANSLSLESYVTDSWTKNPVNTVFFDNLVIARKYIGPAGE